MPETEYISHIYRTVLFFCPEISYIKFYTLLNYKDLQLKRATNLATNHSADSDYKDFINIYRKCLSEPYSFLTIDTTLPASCSLRFRKNLLLPYKNDIN